MKRSSQITFGGKKSAFHRRCSAMKNGVIASSDEKKRLWFLNGSGYYDFLEIIYSLFNLQMILCELDKCSAAYLSFFK